MITKFDVPKNVYQGKHNGTYVLKRNLNEEKYFKEPMYFRVFEHHVDTPAKNKYFLLLE